MTAGKVVAVLAVWITTGILFVTTLNTEFVQGGNFFGWILLVSILGIAAGATGSITSGSNAAVQSSSSKDSERKEAAGKAKRGENIEEMLALLDEDDLYDLRQRVKQRLIDRLEDGGASDVASFEQLLNEQGRKRR
ncbi:MAG: hypothetical protein IPM16_21600 [Chloroflexi bacterium]|nr:hypothetical protein [Chloroflexota bacterium]